MRTIAYILSAMDRNFILGSFIEEENTENRKGQESITTRRVRNDLQDLPILNLPQNK